MDEETAKGVKQLPGALTSLEEDPRGHLVLVKEINRLLNEEAKRKDLDPRV